MRPYFDTRGRPWLIWVGFALTGLRSPCCLSP
jgi:hypothetical protein